MRQRPRLRQRARAGDICRTRAGHALHCCRCCCRPRSGTPHHRSPKAHSQHCRCLLGRACEFGVVLAHHFAPVSAPSQLQAPNDNTEMETFLLHQRSRSVRGASCSLPDSHLICHSSLEIKRLQTLQCRAALGRSAVQGSSPIQALGARTVQHARCRGRASCTSSGPSCQYTLAAVKRAWGPGRAPDLAGAAAVHCDQRTLPAVKSLCDLQEVAREAT